MDSQQRREYIRKQLENEDTRQASINDFLTVHETIVQSHISLPHYNKYVLLEKINIAYEQHHHHILAEELRKMDPQEFVRLDELFFKLLEKVIEHGKKD